jgi:hypothetical protein
MYDTLSCVPEIKVAFREWPLRLRIEDEMKPLPVIVTVVSGAPYAEMSARLG